MCTMQYFGEFVLIIPLLKSKCKFFVFIKWQSITPDASSPFHSVNLKPLLSAAYLKRPLFGE